MWRPRLRVSRRLKKQLLTNKRQHWRHNAYKVQNGLCAYCGVTMVLEPKNKFEQFRCCTLDHKLPLSRGGDDHWENIAAACHRCNQTKKDMTDIEFLSLKARQDIGQLSRQGGSNVP